MLGIKTKDAEIKRKMDHTIMFIVFKIKILFIIYQYLNKIFQLSK